MKAPTAPIPAWRRWRDRLLLQEDLNFLLTNRVPRIALTRAMGRFAAIESPALTRLSIAVWRLFTDLDLSEAEPRRYTRLQQVFTRALRPGARPVDAGADVVVSPCDGIVGATGTVHAGSVLQAKGMPYRLAELLGDAARAAVFEGGRYVTLRLTSSMYHRFHAPCDARVEGVSYLAGDTFNVNPIAVRRIERLFCRNERAAIRLRTPQGEPITVVAVAAILVASIRLHFLDVLLHVRWPGPTELPCAVAVARGEEMGWFEHGSTLVVFVPTGFALADGIAEGRRLRMGEALLRREASVCHRPDAEASPDDRSSRLA